MVNNQENTTNILGVKINADTKSAILEKVEQLLQDEQQHYIVTPNPEIVMHSTTDLSYLSILNNADLSLPDGIGLKIASCLTKNRVKQRIRGVDFVEDLCKIIEHNNYSIFLLGGEEEIAKRTAEVLQTKFPHLNIKGAEVGGEVSEQGALRNENILVKINQLKPDILFVAFGFPKQEKFINNYLSRLASVKLAIGVGGSFDFISGKTKRAPKIFRKLGFEWLWRLVIEPWRWQRIYTATIKFPLCFLKWKIKN